jgi:hypothetical protein
MKRKSLLLLMLIALFAPLAMNAQTTQLVQVTSLEVGETYVITCGNYAVGNTVYTTSNNHMITSVSFSASDTPSTSIQYTVESGDATNGYIFKNVENGKYIGYTSDEYLSLVESGGTPHKYDGTDLTNSIDSEGYYYVALASSTYNYAYFTTSKNSQTSNPIVIYKLTEGGQGGGDTYVWVETTTITPNEEYLIGFSDGNNVYLAVNYAVNQTNHYYENSNSSYYGYTAMASFDGNGYVTGVSGHATDLQYCTWKFSSASGGTITSGYESNKYLRTWTSTSYADCYVDGTSQTWTYSSGTLYRTISSTNRYAQYTTINSTPHMCVANSVPTGYSVKLYTKQLVETGYAVNAGTMSNGSIQFSINGGYNWYDNLSNVAAGETVVISVEPETGYQLQGTPTVTPVSGTAPTVSGSGNLYSFVMPESDVTVNATFNCTAPADPTFSVATGSYTTLQNVSISCATAGATIYYTTDGSTPTNSSTQYTGAIAINSTTTLKAIAYIGTCASNVVSATYTMSLPTYTVTCATGLTGGSIAANPASAVEGTTITITATPESGYFLATITATDGNNTDVPVTIDGNTGTFTMPASNVTVTATFTQGFHVTLNQTPNGTISADQTTNLQPGDIVTLTATPDNDCVFLAWYVFKDGDPRDVIALVNNSWFFMPSSNVTVQAVFVTEEEHEQTVGGGDNTNANLPTNVYYNYSLTQQIYTAAEIGYNGRITAIAFKANGTASRKLDIYMAHTSKTAFTSTTDWQTMGPSFLVYSGDSGNISFSSSDWTTITLDTPFEYDGTSNLNICVVDITGSWVSNITFNTYSTSANRAMYVASDGTDYSQGVNASGISDYTGTQSTVNNQIKFTIKVPGSAESLTISPDAISDFSYVEGQGPSQSHKLDIVGVDLENNITITAPTNFEVCLTENGTYTSSLTIPRETSKGNRAATTWEFESDLEGWTAYDVDNDGYYWEHSSVSTNFDAYNSDGCVVSASFINNVGALTPDNWLVSPQVTLGGTFSLYAVAQDQAWPDEHFGIYVSTDGETFTVLGEWTLSAGDWRQYSVDLRAYAGQSGYIAVRHFNCTDKYYIKVDHFVLDTDAHIEIEMPVTITPATVFVRMKANLNRGNYSGTLTASAGSGTNVNGSVSLSGVVEAPSYNITLAPNPFDGGEVIGEGSYTDGTEITVTATKRGNYSFINWTENGTVVSTDASYTFTVNGSDRSLVANFGFIKHIDAYTEDGGYYLIASPIGQVSPTDVTNMLTNSYDLYYFDQAREYEWVNYKGSNGNFNMNRGQGYLYANSEDVDLIFIGTANTNGEVTLTYSDDNPDETMHGWNLVGNPFTVEAYIDRPFYAMEEGGVRIMPEPISRAIQPMEAVFVIANENEEQMAFSTETPNKIDRRLVINVSQDRGSTVDRAFAIFETRSVLPKFMLNPNDTKIYIPKDGDEFAVVNCNKYGTLPISFEAAQDGIYSISVNSENILVRYLHLVDHREGIDIDLLSTPNYRFDAKTTDKPYRFDLVYKTGSVLFKDLFSRADAENFSFCNNDSWIINNEGEAILQVIDVNGRIMSSENINGCYTKHIDVAPGLYMLRLINGNDVKVQKVVVR